MVVAIPAIALADILYLLFLAVTAYAAYILIVWALQQLQGPLGWTGVDFLGFAQAAGQQVAQWADQSAAGMYGAVGAVVGGIAQNLDTAIGSVGDLAHAIASALLNLQSTQQWLVQQVSGLEALGNVAAVIASIRDTVNNLASNQSAIVTTLNAEIAAEQQDVNALYQDVRSAYNAAVQASVVYTDAVARNIESAVNQDVASLQAGIGQADNAIAHVEQEAWGFAAAALSQSEEYTRNLVGQLAQEVGGWITQEVQAAESTLNDRINGVAAALLNDISGVSNALKAEIVSVAAQAAQEDAALSSDVKQAIAAVASQAAAAEGVLSTTLQRDIADVTGAIQAQGTSLSNTITASVAALAAKVAANEGALSDTLQGDIAGVAAQAAAARAALQGTLGTAIASTAAKTSAIAQTVATLEEECVNPLCEGFKDMAPAQQALRQAGLDSLFLLLIEGAIANPRETATLFGDVVNTLSGPLESSLAALIR